MSDNCIGCGACSRS
ncbi:hypothetical protein KII78_05485 [Helicobacter pylori]|nr:hypothetical protein [Helicobacter pylori]